MNIIKKITLGHCMRGPEKCEKCRNEQDEKYTLLELDTNGDYARPLILFLGEWHTYDVIKIFDTETGAIEYAKKNKVKLILRRKYNIVCKICSSTVDMELDEDDFEAVRGNYSCGGCRGLP